MFFLGGIHRNSSLTWELQMQFPGEWFAQETPAELPGLQRWFIFTSGSNKGEGRSDETKTWLIWMEDKSLQG